MNPLLLVAAQISGAACERTVRNELLGNADESAVRALLAGAGVIAPLDAVYGTEPCAAAEQVMRRLDREDVRVITLADPHYPRLLREIHQPPLVLYIRGELTGAPAIALVGTRNAHPAGIRAAFRFAGALAGSGWCVVSGMAAGIDREAHRGALEAGGGTIGVLAGGIDSRYPRSNADIYRAIDASALSCLIAEYPPGMNNPTWAFARRNRIISGLATHVLVVQAGSRSGALITARYALEQNRELMACPGPPLDAAWAGCNSLIRSGAAVVASLEDMEAELGALRRQCAPEMPSRPAVASGFAGQVLAFIASGGGCSMDALLERFAPAHAEVMTALAELEMEGVVYRRGANVLI